MRFLRSKPLQFGVLILGLLVLASSLSVCSAQSQTFAYVNITDGWATSENITIAENNWVNLQGGTEVTIPQLTFVYNGFNQTNYTKDSGSRTINITVNVSENTDHTVGYPNTTHQLFYNDSTVAISFNTTVISETAYYYVARTHATQMRDICQAIVDGNTTTFRDLFFNNSVYNGTVNLPDGNATIEHPDAADWVLVLTDNPLNASNFTLISTTFIEVLEYKSTLTAPTSIDQNADLDVTMNITGASSDLQYRYGGALIKKSVYEQAREIKLISNASEAGSNLTFGDASLIENWGILGVGLGNVGATKAQETINKLFGANNGTVTFVDPTNSLSKGIPFTTLNLPIGTYTLLVGVWQGNDRLVAFNQTEVKIAVPTFAQVNITGGWAASENIGIAENNWVNLQGGTEVTIPQLTFVYNGFNQTNYTKDGGSRTINITVDVSENTDHTVSYPNTTHQLFYNDSTVTISFNTTVSGPAYYYVAKTYPTQMRDICQAIVDGNTTTFRDLFFNSSVYNGTVSLPDGTATISTPDAADWVLVLTDNPLNASNFTLISTTFIEVLEYKSTLTAPTSIDQNADLDVTMNITGASSDLQYRYGGALIKKSVYEQAREIKLISNASEAGSNLTFGDASLIENWGILGVGLGNVGATKAQETINKLFGANNGTVTFVDPTNSLSKGIPFTTLNLPIGTYTLLVGVWQGNDRLVAFNQTDIDIGTSGIKGKIRGIVKDADTEIAIEGATVTAAATGEVTQTDLTDASGHYVISTNEGTYTVSVDKSGYVSKSSDSPVTVQWNESETVNFELTRAYVEIGLKTGEISPKRGNVSELIPFNLTVQNYGRTSTYTITNSSVANATITKPSATGEIAAGGSENICVNITASAKGTYPVTITVSNTTYGISASTIVVVNAVNITDTGWNDTTSDVSTDSDLSNGSLVMNHSNITDGSEIGTGTIVDNSNVSNTTTRGDATIVDSVTTNTTITDSFVSEGSNVTRGTVANSTVTNTTIMDSDITENSTVDNSTATDTTITDSFVSEASNVTGGTVNGTTVKDTTATETTLVDAVVEHSTITDATVTNANLTRVTATNCSITDVDLTNIVLEKATVAKNVTTGKAEIAGETEAKVNLSGAGGVEISFANIYETVAVDDLVKNQTSPQTISANTVTNTSAADAAEVKSSLSLNSSVAGNVTISKCGISPGGSTFTLAGFEEDIVGDFIHISTDIPPENQTTVKICLYFGTTEPDVSEYNVTRYNETTDAAWDKFTPTKENRTGDWYLCAEVDHLSTFAIAAAVAAAVEAGVISPPPSGVGEGPAAAPVMNVPVNPETGAVTSTTTLTVAKATLTIHEGIIVKDAAGNPLSTSITMLHTPSTAKNIGAIAAYDFGPSGTTFSKPIDLVIAYDPAEIPAGFREADFVVKMYDGTSAKWIDLDTTVDTVAHTATAKVSHFTVFALFAEKAVIPIPPTTPSPTPTVTPTPVPISPVLPSAKPPWALIIVGIIAVVIAVGAVVYYYYYYKKRGST